MMMRSWTGLSAGNRQSNVSFEQPGVDLSSGLGSAPQKQEPNYFLVKIIRK